MNTTKRHSINHSETEARFLINLLYTMSFKLKNGRFFFSPIKISAMGFNDTKTFIFIFVHVYCCHQKQQELKNELGNENSFLNTSLNYLTQAIYKIKAKYLYFTTKSSLCSGRMQLFSQIFVKTQTKQWQILIFVN